MEKKWPGRTKELPPGAGGLAVGMVRGGKLGKTKPGGERNQKQTTEQSRAEKRGKGNGKTWEGCMEFLDYEVDGTTLPFRGRDNPSLSFSSKSLFVFDDGS